MSPWAPGLLAFVIAKKYSPVSLSKRVSCVVSITAITNIDYKYMKFCTGDIYGSYMGQVENSETSETSETS